MIWDDILTILFCSYYTYFSFTKDISKKTAKEWDWWSIGVYSNSRMHKNERKISSILMIIFMWTIGYAVISGILESIFKSMAIFN